MEESSNRYSLIKIVNVFRDIFLVKYFVLFVEYLRHEYLLSFTKRQDPNLSLSPWASQSLLNFRHWMATKSSVSAKSGHLYEYKTSMLKTGRSWEEVRGLTST